MARNPRRIEAQIFRAPNRTIQSWEVDTLSKGKLLVVGARLDVVEGGAITFTAEGENAPFFTLPPQLTALSKVYLRERRADATPFARALDYRSRPGGRTIVGIMDT
jgi:hypothetical protein